MISVYIASEDKHINPIYIMLIKKSVFNIFWFFLCFWKESEFNQNDQLNQTL